MKRFRFGFEFNCHFGFYLKLILCFMTQVQVVKGIPIRHSWLELIQVLASMLASVGVVDGDE